MRRPRETVVSSSPRRARGAKKTAPGQKPPRPPCPQAAQSPLLSSPARRIVTLRCHKLLGALPGWSGGAQNTRSTACTTPTSRREKERHSCPSRLASPQRELILAVTLRCGFRGTCNAAQLTQSVQSERHAVVWPQADLSSLSRSRSGAAVSPRLHSCS